MGRQDPQINLRLKPDRYAVLQAAAFVHDVAMKDLAQDAVDRAIDQYAKLASVKKALEARSEQAAEAKGKVSAIRRRNS